MRRGLLIAALVILALTAALWVAARVEQSPLARSNGDKRVPVVVAGRDRATDGVEAPVREAEDGASLRCRYDGEGVPGKLVAVGEEVLEGSAGGSTLSLTLPPGTWSVHWQSPDGQAVPLGAIEAGDGEVYTCDLSEAGWQVRGTVTNEDGRALPEVDVYVCGKRVQTDESGAFRAVGGARACTVRAIYRDGILARRSEPVVVSPWEARAVALVVDDGPIAGMGIAFRMADQGARVLTVHPATPAEDAGLEAGDIILAVDGTRTAGLSDDDFIKLGTGPEGSRVTLEVERGGERRTISFDRERLEVVDTGAPAIR